MITPLVLVRNPQLHVYILSLFTQYVIDIDECSEGIDGCAQICIDMDGNYSCSCDLGYLLGSDDHRCDGEPLCVI